VRSRLARDTSAAIAVLMMTVSQATFGQPETRAAFLAASEPYLESALKTTPNDAALGLDAVIAAQLPAISRYFGLTIRYRWADANGSSAHPELGLFLSRRQIVRMRDSVGLDGLDDVLRFVLTHESAHLRQFRVYNPEKTNDPGLTRTRECQADLMAAMAIVNIFSDMGVPIGESSARLNRAVAAAFSLPPPQWDDHRQHPSPHQRSVCVTVGFNGGLHQWTIALHERTGDSTLLRQIVEARRRNPVLFAPGEDIMTWSWRTAESITGFGGAQMVNIGEPTDLTGRFRQLASAAERGAHVLQRDVHLLQAALGPPKWMTCEPHSAKPGSGIRCVSWEFASAAMARTSWGLDVEIAGGALAPLGWGEVPARHKRAGTAERCYAPNPDAPASICIIVAERERRFEIVALGQ
jgi:hypothetical protein